MSEGNSSADENCPGGNCTVGHCPEEVVGEIVQVAIVGEEKRVVRITHDRFTHAHAVFIEQFDLSITVKNHVSPGDLRCRKRKKKIEFRGEYSI